MNTTTPIKLTHNGVEITYDEGRNLFCFELRSRARTADSLRAAKEAIDKPRPKEKKPFTRFKAWRSRPYSMEWEPVEVTSIAEARYGSATEAWITDKKGSREKTGAYSLFPCNEQNNELIASMLEVQKKIDTLTKEFAALKEKLKAYEIPKEE